MSHFDDTIKIGSNVRGGASSVGPKVLKGKALSDAKRSGAPIVAEKKEFAGQQNGQFMTKIDRADDIVKPTTVGKVVGQAISDRRQKMVPKMTQKELAAKSFMTPAEVADFERGTAAPNQKYLGALERVLGIKLRGNDIGALKNPPKENPPKKK